MLSIALLLENCNCCDGHHITMPQLCELTTQAKGQFPNFREVTD